MPEDSGEDDSGGIMDREQLALGTIACLLLSLAVGLLPDSLVPAVYRTGAWIFFDLLALLLLYMGFPHMWPYGLWLGGIYLATTVGLILMLGGGERIFARYWAGAVIGLLMELTALFMVYTLLMRIRIARAVFGSRAPLGLWLMAVLLFFLFSNLAAAGWSAWASTGSVGPLAAYAAFEVFLAVMAVYICWAPEQAVWGTATTAAGAEAPAPAPEPGAVALLKRMVGRKEEPPGECPACGAPLRAVRLKCPACGQPAESLWCAASESYVVPCPSCGGHTLSAEGKCIKCAAPFPGLACPSCKKVSPLRHWQKGS